MGSPGTPAATMKLNWFGSGGGFTDVPGLANDEAPLPVALPPRTSQKGRNDGTGKLFMVQTVRLNL